MNEPDKNKTTEEAPQPLPEHEYILRLYVAGTTPQSVLAIQNIQKICANYLHNLYTLEVIDIYQQPQLVHTDQIIAVPTLVRHLPLSSGKLIGNMSDSERVLSWLGLQPEKYDLSGTN